MRKNALLYYPLALKYLSNYYSHVDNLHCYLGFSFINGLVKEGEKIGESAGLQDTELDKALLTICFRYAGVINFFRDEEIKYRLLADFAIQAGCPENVKDTIAQLLVQHMHFAKPASLPEKVAWDALNSRFAIDDLIVRLSFLKKQINEMGEGALSEMEVLQNFRDEFTRWNYYTEYAKKQYSEMKEKNFIRLGKRIRKLEESASPEKKELKGTGSNLSSKETEDLFKTAFRNYSHLVAVADSKAGLLIHVNSIIISVVIGFLIGRSDKYPHLLVPSFILLTVAFLTICLSILASRPQGNRLPGTKSTSAYPTFFFGSFDLIGRNFLKVEWEKYSLELSEFLQGDRQWVLEEVFKETYHVRRVLSKKFSYLSIAYWIFLTGLFVSIVVFFFSARGA